MILVYSSVSFLKLTDSILKVQVIYSLIATEFNICTSNGDKATNVFYNNKSEK